MFLTIFALVRLPTDVGALLEGLDAADVDADRGVELQRLTAGGGFRGAEEDADLLAELVDEDRGGLGLAQPAGDLTQRLAHQSGLQADVAVAHLAFDFGAGHQRGHGVDDDDVQRAGADQHVHDFERLLAGVRLGDEERVGVDAELGGVFRVERVLGVDEGGDAALALGVGHGVQRDGGLTGGFRAVDLDDAAAGQAANSEGHVQRDGAGGDDLDGRTDFVAQAHDRAFAELLVNLGKRCVERLLAIRGCGHDSHL